MTLIGQVGFPIAVAVFLLYERSKSFKEVNDRFELIRQESVSRNSLMMEIIKSNTVSQTELRVTIQKLCEIVNGKDQP